MENEKPPRDRGLFDLGEIFKGIFVPSFPENSILTIVGLIGTTVVPYNLFLHASLVKEKTVGLVFI